MTIPPADLAFLDRCAKLVPPPHPAVLTTVSACRSLRAAEALLASVGFYSQADVIRTQRVAIEKSTASSVAAGSPAESEYQPTTIRTLVEAKEPA